MFEQIDNLIHVLESRSIEYTVELKNDWVHVHFNSDCTQCTARYYPNEKRFAIDDDYSTVSFVDGALIECDGVYLIFAGNHNHYYLRLPPIDNPTKTMTDIVVD